MGSRRAKGPNGEGSVYQRASDGKWVAAVTLPSGRRKVVYGDTEKDALRERRKLLAEVEAGKPVPGGRTPTLSQYLAEWLDVRLKGEVEAGHLDEETLDNYAYLIRTHIEPTFLAKVKLNALGTDDIRAWQRDRLKAKSNLGRPYSRRTVALAHKALRRALNDAVRDEKLGRNVAALVPLPAASEAIELPSEAELEKVFVEMLNDRMRVLWFTMLAFGPRRGEALGMRWSLVDLENGTVSLRKQIRRRNGKLVEKELKTKESRATVSIPAALVEMLKEHRREQIKARLAAPVWADPDLVFTTRVGTPIEPRNVNRAWAALRERAGVPNIRVHDLRHAAASMAFAAGASVKEVQGMLRHTRERITSDLYIHITESVRRGTADKMDRVLRKIVGS